MVTGRRGVVAAGHYLAAAAGAKMFAKGGNAVDAGVAAGFALAVLKPCENSLGGECPILIYSPRDKKVYSISGQGTAPKKATIEWFKSRDINLIPGDGYLGATVPAMFGSYATALREFGRLSLADVLEPAIELASEGHPIYEQFSEKIAEHAKRYREEWPSTADVFLPGGTIPAPGQILKQPALANTLRRIANAGTEAENANAAAFAGKCREDAINSAIDYFYKGDVADAILEFTHSFPVKDASGEYHTSLLEKDDFATYATRIVEPVCAHYKDFTVYKCGPWTQGPVFLQQLKLLEGFDLKSMGHNSAEYIHTVIECSKLAFDDREKYYGDPLFAEVPLNRLLSAEYNDLRRRGIDPQKANNSPLWEQPGALDIIGATDMDAGVSGALGKGAGFDGDTTHLDAADAEGFMMSAMPSGAWIHSSPIIPALGFPIGTRGQMFSLTKGRPNSLEPGKRPRTTLTPGIAFKCGKPWMAFGSPGGDCQDQWALQFFINVADFGMDLQEAADKPSFHTNHFINSFYPKNTVIGAVYVEEDINMGELLKLQAKGHSLHMLSRNNNGMINAAGFDHATGTIVGAASPKGDGQGYVAGY